MIFLLVTVSGIPQSEMLPLWFKCLDRAACPPWKRCYSWKGVGYSVGRSGVNSWSGMSDVKAKGAGQQLQP